MNKQPEDWLDDVPENENEDDDEIIWVSKSEIKRDAEALKDLGAEMVDLGKNALDRIPLDEDLRAAIELAQKIKKEGRRRQPENLGGTDSRRWSPPYRPQTARGSRRPPAVRRRTRPAQRRCR